MAHSIHFLQTPKLSLGKNNIRKLYLQVRKNKNMLFFDRLKTNENDQVYKYILFFKESCGGSYSIYLMDQESLLFESSGVIRQDLSTTPFVRHYMQEQSFAFNANEKLKVELPFNHIINQIVSELSILNKQIASNSRLTSSLLENGREIYLTKSHLFADFIKLYPIIADSLASMPPHFRLVFQYSAMALSNLILKLSINMAKISIVIATKILTPPYLNLFTVAVLFEKYLELQVLNKKSASSPEEHRHFLKQFPKITFVKISKKRNPYDIDFIQCSQTAFNSAKENSKQASSQVRNIQFIELFEEESEGFIKIKKQHQQNSLYDTILDLSEFGLKAPFGYELYLLMAEIVVPKMNDFKPDSIIYVENFDNDAVSIEAKVRGMIINQFSEKVQQKIYVFKEFGITESMKTSWLQDHAQQQLPEVKYQFGQKVSKFLEMSDGAKARSFISTCYQEEDKNQVKLYMQQNMKITQDVFKQLHNHFKTEYRKDTIFAVNSPTQNIVFAEQIKSIHKNMLEELTYLSLALIQKSNFQQGLKSYNNYSFNSMFLEKVIEWISRELHIIERSKVFSEFAELYRNKIKKIKGMQVLSMVSPQLPQKTLTFYNFLNLREQKLQFVHAKGILPIPIRKEDSFYVAYVQSFIILTVFGQAYYTIYRKNRKDNYFKSIKAGQTSNQNPSLFKRHSTFVANNKYLYKAFGESKHQQLNHESQVFRLLIQKPMEIEWSKWQSLGSQCIPYSPASKTTKKSTPTIPIQLKKNGYGYSYDTLQQQRQVNMTILGGGYNFKIQNQQKVNRYFYIIKNNGKEIYKIGKTNNELVDQTVNMRNKTILYPFIYGVPILHNQGELTILNTNGYLENANHFKKMFLTKLRIGPITSLSSIGIIGQNKLDYNKQSAQITVANKNTILTYLMQSYNRINRYKNQVAVYNSENKIFLLESCKQTEVEPFDVVRVTPIDYQQMSDDLETISINFASKKMILK